MYWKLRSSTSAGSSFSPDLYVRSRTEPFSMLRIFTRVKAWPLPGLTNWKSTTVYGEPSTIIFKPLRMSLVSMEVPPPLPHCAASLYMFLPGGLTGGAENQPHFWRKDRESAG
jgi:hypothetical protein